MAEPILNHTQSHRALERMAYQIAEAYFGQPDLTLVGLMPRGKYLAEVLAATLRGLEYAPPLNLVYLKKQADLPADLQPTLHNRAVLLVDDVLNTGETLLQALQSVWRAKPHSVRVAVLVDRSYRRVPISADFIGLELATTLQEYVTVRIEPDKGVIEAELNPHKPAARVGL